MNNTYKVSDDFNIVVEMSPAQLPQTAQNGSKIKAMFKKLRGGFFLVIGYLMSPLSWWNDLFFNMPIAYGFGYVCSWLNPNLLVPCTIAGYWLSNIAGILLMQVGAVDVFQGQAKKSNLRKELLTGLVSSTAYTLVILGLVHFKILNTPVLFSLFGS